MDIWQATLMRAFATQQLGDPTETQEQEGSDAEEYQENV